MKRSAFVVDEAAILGVLDGTWRTMAKIRGQIGRASAPDVAALLDRMAKEGKIEQMSEVTTVINSNGKRLKIMSYRLRSNSQEPGCTDR